VPRCPSFQLADSSDIARQTFENPFQHTCSADACAHALNSVRCAPILYPCLLFYIIRSEDPVLSVVILPIPMSGAGPGISGRMLWSTVALGCLLLCCSHHAAAAGAAFDLADATQAALYAAAAYCNPLSLLTWQCKACSKLPGVLTIRPVMDVSPTQFTYAYVTLNPLTQDLVVAFRGTNGVPINQDPLHTAESILNWITNLKVGTNEYPAFVNGSRAHVGFKESFEGVKTQLVSTVRALLHLAPKRILVVGHSLGKCFCVRVGGCICVWQT